jgi:molybdate transport system regulatory protein
MKTWAHARLEVRFRMGIQQAGTIAPWPGKVALLEDRRDEPIYVERRLFSGAQ